MSIFIYCNPPNALRSKNVVLYEIVLKNLREAIDYVTEHEAEFVQEAADSRLRERDAEFSRKRETLSKAETRIAELDNLFKHLYEDNVTGKLGSVEKVGVAPDPKRVGPASCNLEYG